jgi:hypothetical protein
MKTTYITFTREMARAYAEGRKRMTRLVIKWPKWIQTELSDERSINKIVDIMNSNEYRGVIKRGYCDGVEAHYKCPYDKPGDQIMLGTTWATLEKYDNRKPSDLPTEEMQPSTPGSVIRWEPIPLWSYFDSDEKPEGFGKLRPGRFLPGFLRDRMPRETLRIVRAERVQDITNEEAILEGIFETPREPGFDCWSTHGMREYYPTPREAFKALWESINKDRGYGFGLNPWVWVLGW